MTPIEEALADLEGAEQDSFDAQRVANEYRSNLCRVLAQELGIETVAVSWFWICPTSPTKHCIYNDATDPWHDDCLFCHDPKERK